jgi:uncharacterized protein (DUF3084 family)
MDTEKEQEKNKKVESEGEENGALQLENAVLAGELKSRDIVILKLQQEAAAKESEIVAVKKELEELKQVMDGIGKVITQAIAAYRELVIQANPGILPELITGDTIEAINESVKNARAIMDRVRRGIEAEAARTRIPAGAPQRAPLDLSALSPREKIKYALEGG